MRPLPKPSVPLNMATVEKGSPLYENSQPVPGWPTWSGKSVAVLGSVI